MKEKIINIIVVFGVIFLLINIIGYIFNITEFVTILDNPTGGGGTSISNIPFILSFIFTIVIYLIRKILVRK